MCGFFYGVGKGVSVWDRYLVCVSGGCMVWHIITVLFWRYIYTYYIDPVNLIT